MKSGSGCKYEIANHLINDETFKRISMIPRFSHVTLRKEKKKLNQLSFYVITKKKLLIEILMNIKMIF